MNILAIDLGNHTGYALQNGQHLYSGVMDFSPNRFAGGGMRYLKFVNWLNLLIEAGPIDAVYYEEVRRHLGTDAAHVYGGFQAHLEKWCEEHKIPYEGVPVGTIKKHATGRGNANKDLMIAAANSHGWPTSDDNEADALWLLDYVLSHMPKKGEFHAEKDDRKTQE